LGLKTPGVWHGSIWHPIKRFPGKKVWTGGKKGDIDTTLIWQDYGIYEAKKEITKKHIKTGLGKVYIANHIRAILDMLYDMIHTVGIISEIDNASMDYLGGSTSRDELLMRSKLMEKCLNWEELEVYKEWYEHEKTVFLGESRWV
jgi:hypothetical protein